MMQLQPDPALLVRSTLDDTAVRRACNAGALIRLAPGRLLRREHWEAFDDAARHAMTAIAAVSCLRTPVVVSHESAAAFWGLPRLGPWPARVHVIDSRLEMPTAGRYVLRHAGPIDECDRVERYGVSVTSLARTAVDLAVTTPLRQAVVSLDHLYRHDAVSSVELLDRIAERAVARGTKKARRAVEFADGRANRPGESLSRVVMLEAGVMAPGLQHPFHGPLVQIADTDFYWESVGIIGEFDGETKYRDSERWSGLSPEQVVVNEKNRENWLRSLPEVRGFVRWTWREALTRGSLPRLLREAGVPLAQEVRFSS
jgi:hypothetical protein